MEAKVRNCLTREEKNLEKGKLFSDILRRSKSDVYRVISRFKAGKTLEPKPRTDRPLMTTKRGDEMIVKISLKDRFDTAKSISRAFYEQIIIIIIMSRLVARISLTLSRHSSISFIALGRSSGQHSLSSHSCWMYVRAGRPAFARPYVGVHKSTSLMSLSLLLQQCPACLVRLTWIVFVIGGRWPYSWCLVGCCRQDLFKIARSILV